MAAAPPGRAEKQTDRRVCGAQDVGVDLQLFSRGHVVVGGHGGGEENHGGEYRGVRRQLGQDAGALDADSGVSRYFDHGGRETLRNLDAAPARNRQFGCFIHHSVGGVGVSHLPSLRKWTGESVAWCEFIAVVVGFSDVVVALMVILLFLREKGAAKCLDACFKVRTRARAVSMSVGQGITNLFDRVHGPEAVRARRQTRIRRNTVDVDDGSVEHRDNPLEGIELARTTNAVKSAASKPAATAPAPAAAPAADHPKRRRFERYTTKDGEIFFVDVDTEESVWDLPSDGEEVDASC